MDNGVPPAGHERKISEVVIGVEGVPSRVVIIEGMFENSGKQFCGQEVDVISCGVSLETVLSQPVQNKTGHSP